MSDLRLITHTHMRALVGRMGCLDAVAATIGARWGVAVSKGTVSKKMTGGLDWTVADVIALEEALDDFPVTRALARRLGGASPASGGALSLSSHGGAIAKEAGEAVQAILSAGQSASAMDLADAAREIDEATAALEAARAKLEGLG